MKPEILSKIDQIVSANLGMVIIAMAEPNVFSDSISWLQTQSGYVVDPSKSYLSYNSVNIEPVTSVGDDSGYVIKLTTA